MSKRTEFRKLRQFSVEFKKAIVSEFEQGKFGVRELCKLHSVFLNLLPKKALQDPICPIKWND